MISSEESARSPDWVFIIGSMKSGTTTLFEHLARHPSVCPCRIKEPNFFSDADRWERGLEWYRGFFDWDPTRHRWALEASTSYTKIPIAECPVDRMASVPGKKRFLFLMRDPVDRVRSHISYGKAKGWSTFTNCDGVVPQKAIQVSRYAEQLAPYRDEFGMERLKLLHFDDLVERPADLLADVCRFLGIDDDFSPEDADGAYNVTSQLLVRPDWYERIRDFTPVRWARKRLPVKEVLGPFLPGFRSARSRELDDEQKGQVREELREDLMSLRDIYGVDISRWGYDE